MEADAQAESRKSGSGDPSVAGSRTNSASVGGRSRAGSAKSRSGNAGQHLDSKADETLEEVPREYKERAPSERPSSAISAVPSAPRRNSLLEARMRMSEHQASLLVAKDPEDIGAVNMMNDYLRHAWRRKKKRLKIPDKEDGVSIPILELLKVMEVQGQDRLLWDRSELGTNLQEPLTAMWKTTEHPTAWAKVTFANFIEVAKDIVASKREAKLATKAVCSWHFRHYLLKERKLLAARPETQGNRFARLQEFWLQLHGRHANCPAPTPGLALPSLHHRRPASRPHSPRSTRSTRSSTKQPPHSPPSQAVPPGTPWKARAALSKCSAGTWDWARGSPHLQSAPSFGSRPGTRSKQVDWWPEVSKTGLTLEDADQGAFFDGSPTGVQSSAGDGCDLIATPRGSESRDEEIDIQEFMEPFPFPDKRLLLWWKKAQDPKDVPRTTLKPPVSLMRPNSRLGAKANSLPSLKTPKAGRSRLSTSSSASALAGALAETSPSKAGWPPRPQSSGTVAPLDEGLFSDTESSGASWMPASPSPFVEPWQGTCQISSGESPSRQYLKFCVKKGVVPALTPFATGNSCVLSNMTMEDGDVEALSSILDAASRLDVVDLSGNRSLSDGAVSMLLGQLLGHTAAFTIRHLSLKDCTKVSTMTLAAVSRLVGEDDGALGLSFLDLSGVSIPTKSHVGLAAAVRVHPKLQELKLACTGLGGHTFSKQCVTEIASSKSIHTLDLSWNAFSVDILISLGECLIDTAKIRRLGLESCATAKRVGDTTPIAFFVELLSRKNTLEELNIANNLIDYRAALIIEDSLEFNNTLTSVNLAYNPLGVAGIRSFLRLVARETSGLATFDFRQAYDGSPPGFDDYLFSCTKPTGRYILDFSKPYHRSIMRMLYKICDRLGTNPQDCFLETPNSWSHPAADQDSVRPMPTSGRLSFMFTVEYAENAFEGVGERDFASYLERHYQKLGVTPGPQKTVFLLAEWNNINLHTGEQIIFLDAMAKDFRITYQQMEVICRHRDVRVEAIKRLLPSLAGGVRSTYMVMMLAPCLRDFTSMLGELRNYLGFNVENPTAHYKFDLEKNVDFAMAQRLILVDQWEVCMDKRLKRTDTSQRGNRSHIRNERYMDKPLLANHVGEWSIPEHGILEFDYSSGKRPKADQVEISEKVFDALFIALSSSSCSDMDQVEALRFVSHQIYLPSALFRQILGIYKDDVPRAELFVLFFFLVSDIWNEKIFRVRFEDKAELARLQNRLGYATFFPFVQPEQVMMDLDFSHYDHRLATTIMVNMANKENPNNIRDVVYILPDQHLISNMAFAPASMSATRRDPLPLGVPRSWETKPPPAGWLKFTYVCSAEERNFNLRKRLLATYGFWDCPIESAGDPRMRWWGSLDEAPEDVLEFLEFLSSRYTNVYDAFTAIDGPGGNGNISWLEFEEGVKKIGCKKFKGSDERTKIRCIFKYLDPSGEGQVSRCEWAALEYLWNEIRLSIQEFVTFLERTFLDGLKEAWGFIDDDGSGEITGQEWKEALENLGYFGPPMPIFNFLDKDDEGNVSYDEYKVLEQFSTRPKPPPLPQTDGEDPEGEKQANAAG